MSELDKEVKIVLSKLLDFIVPSGMNAKERRQLADRAGVSEETLRKTTQRQSLNADTLLRLLLARGVSLKTLVNLPQTDFTKLPPGETDWLQFGREASDIEKREYVALLRFLNSKWKLR